MKITAAFTLIFSLVALVITGMFVLAKWDPKPDINDLWTYVSFWPATFINILVGTFNNPASFLRLESFYIITLIIHFGAVITAVVLARSLDRGMWDWGIATFIFPWAAPFLLAFLPEH